MSTQYANIPVKPDVAEELHSRKSRGETYDDIVRELLGMQ